ncbi:hypothetical protein GSI01S_10_02250 [Gordonia sihwensis NBRC 108236]|uniref:Uncharacterized protein n=1 Tax=Gordonia sihwensis NBRC 108236 TaxID=1223544 RepID=L7LKL7_9ACTN|nr:hypothetical protein GSI01S_10_02250 [Gordonia sihwensis NBRC 108236]
MTPDAEQPVARRGGRHVAARFPVVSVRGPPKQRIGGATGSGNDYGEVPPVLETASPCHQLYT